MSAPRSARSPAAAAELTSGAGGGRPPPLWAFARASRSPAVAQPTQAREAYVAFVGA